MSVDHTDRPVVAPSPAEAAAQPDVPDTPDTPGGHPPDAPDAASDHPPDGHTPDTQPPKAPLSAEARHAAFAAGTPRMSPKVIGIGLAVLLALGVGGALADHFVTSSTPAPASTNRSPTGHSGPVVPTHHSTAAVGSELSAPLASFMGLNTLHDASAANFTLTDAATGAPVTLKGLSGRAVVLAFANASCNDICTVLAQELAEADTKLGTTAVPVTFLIVNTDPLDLTASNPAILSRTPLGALHNVRFLTGTVKQLNPVWTTYGISITADHATHVVSHNDLLYFITPGDKVAWAASPFANESATGSYSLPTAEVTRFATGIAHYARKLATGSS